MKKGLIICLSAFQLSSALLGQSVQQGRDLYRQFLEKNKAGDIAGSYSSLWKSYQALSSAAIAIGKNHPEFIELGNLFVEMRPDMERGYAYNVAIGQRSNAILFSRAVIDIESMEEVQPGKLTRSEHYPALAYLAAASTYNSGDFAKAIPYFKAYLSTGEAQHRRDVVNFMMTACLKTKDYASAGEIADEFVASNPSDVNKLKLAANVAMLNSDIDGMRRYLAKAQAISPSDPDVKRLLSVAACGAAGLPSVSSSASGASSVSIPPYSAFAKEYVESRLKKWQEKDPYETQNEYIARVTEEARQAKAKTLLEDAKRKYIATYTKNINLAKGLRLCPYDAENKVFLIESAFGEMVVSVPRENDEARSFESSWGSMQFSNPAFAVVGDGIALTGLTFRTPAGKTYRYDGSSKLNYTQTDVDIKFDALDDKLFAQGASKPLPTVQKNRQNISVGGRSDVDVDIPVSSRRNQECFAVVICNENYDMVASVPMALNDGKSFAQYCEKTLGLPKDNVRLYKDATYGVMMRAMRDISSIAAAYNGDINILFYYAGHGIPDEATKDAFLLPVDADGMHSDGCYSLQKLYGDLGSLNARNVTVFLDACFSGARRDGGMLASARGVALKSKNGDPKGNMVIFSAASDDETAMPYTDKGHGLFTYYLLKKLKETKGNVTLAELGSYLSENVRKQSIVVNHKVQTPSVKASAAVASTWQKMKIAP